MMKKIVYIILEEIRQALKRGERVELRGFGIFFTNVQKARISRNPKTGEEVHVSAKRLPVWRTGTELRQRVDSGFAATDE